MTRDRNTWSTIKKNFYPNKKYILTTFFYILTVSPTRERNTCCSSETQVVLFSVRNTLIKYRLIISLNVSCRNTQLITSYKYCEGNILQSMEISFFESIYKTVVSWIFVLANKNSWISWENNYLIFLSFWVDW